jgi:hypothetical protein
MQATIMSRSTSCCANNEPHALYLLYTPNIFRQQSMKALQDKVAHQNETAGFALSPSGGKYKSNLPIDHIELDS